jgi:hypothetical protein
MDELRNPLVRPNRFQTAELPPEMGELSHSHETIRVAMWNRRTYARIKESAVWSFNLCPDSGDGMRSVTNSFDALSSFKYLD